MIRGQRTVRAALHREQRIAAPASIGSRLSLRVRQRGTVSTGSGASVELLHVSKDYGSVRAVSDFSLNVQPGRFVTLLGPSGSGKTTVLQMIAGLIEPTSGAIRINGEPADGVPPDRRNVGVVFQHYALFPHLTVAQNLAFPLEMRHLASAEIRELVGHALELVGMAGLENRRPRQLSGGQQQRVALARALIYRPPVILMDEPLGALDKNLRQQMQVEIKRIQSDLGLTVIYVTHDQAEALQMSDEVCVIAAGRAVQVGQPRQLYDRPANEFVATSLGEANLFPGQIAHVESATGVARAAGPGGLTALGSSAPYAGAGGGLGAATVGDRVTIIVRPEDVHLASGHNGHAGLDALVESVAFAGDALRVQLTVDGRSAVVAKLPKASSNPPRVGSTVTVTWREQDATFVTADEEESENL